MGQTSMSRGFGAHGDGLSQQSGSVPAMYGVLSPKSKKADPDTSSNYGYAPKSKLLYQRKSAQNKRSKTGNKYSGSRQGMREHVGPYLGEEDAHSQLSKVNMKRFNETIERSQGPKSQISQNRSIQNQSKARSQVGSRAATRSMLSGTLK